MKKINVLLLACVLLFSSSIYAMASEQNTYEQIQEKLNNILFTVEHEKELYGLEGVDFTQLSLGSKIPAYNASENGYVSVENIEYYPVIFENNWVATAVVFYDEGDMNIQFSVAYAQDFTGDMQSDIALIFNENGAYLLDDEQLQEMVSVDNNEVDTYSIDVINNLSIDDILTSKLEVVAPLNVNDATFATDIQPFSFDNQHYLDVSTVKQDAGSLQCWAASIASISGYYGRSSYNTIDKVYNFTGVRKYNGQDIYDCMNHLEDMGYDISIYWQGSFNWYQLRTEIAIYENPIFASISYGSGRGHAVVIRGFYVNQNISAPGIISYMDPDVGRMLASAVDKDKEFKYVPYGSSSTYNFEGFVAVDY